MIDPAANEACLETVNIEESTGNKNLFLLLLYIPDVYVFDYFQ